MPFMNNTKNQMKTRKTNKSRSSKTDINTPVTSGASKPAVVTTPTGAAPAIETKSVETRAPMAVTPRATTVTPLASKAPADTTPAPRRTITTELIAARAYTLWEQQGRPHGNDLQNWLLAESQLKQEVQSFRA